MMNKGSCLCGDIEWKLDGPVTMAVDCHCSMCRKSHGSAYATFAMASAKDFAWLRGADKATVYKSSADGGRAFCPRCGSTVPAELGEMVLMPVGNFEVDIGRPLDCHIFTANKAPWYEITDAAPQFDAYPPDYDKPATDIGERLPETDGAVGGSCLCGKVRFEFDAPADRMMNCHCARCRKSRSAVHSTQVFVVADRFRWLKGEDNVRTYQVPDAKRFGAAFCKDCGSKLPRMYTESNLAVMPAGSLDQDPGIRPQAHIFVGSKSPSHTISDSLPQHEEYP